MEKTDRKNYVGPARKPTKRVETDKVLDKVSQASQMEVVKLHGIRRVGFWWICGFVDFGLSHAEIDRTWQK